MDDHLEQVSKICKKHQRKIPQLRDRLGTYPSVSESCAQLDVLLQRVVDAFTNGTIMVAEMPARVFPWIYASFNLAIAASFSCLHEAAIQGVTSTNNCWIGSALPPTPYPMPKPSEPIKLPQSGTAVHTFISRDWQQHRKLYEAHNFLKLICEELLPALRYLCKQLTLGNAPPSAFAPKDPRAMVVAAEESIVKLRKENWLLLFGRRPPPS